MRNISRYIYIFLSLGIGALFVYSGYTKLYPIQSFEYTMVEFVRLPWLAAAIAARTIIGLEFGLGVLIATHLYGSNKWVLKTAFSLLVAFSLYLIYLWTTAGNNINCGCFGDAIWMSPSASLIKNAIMLVITGLLIRNHNGFTGLKWYGIATLAVPVVAISSLFIFFGLPNNQPNWLQTDHYEIDFAELGLHGGSNPIPLYGPAPGVPTAELHADTLHAIDLNKGKHILAFLSQTCKHCRMAAYKMHLIKEKNPDISFFMVIGGTTSDLTDFWKATKAQNIPYTRLEKAPFMNYTGGIFPLIIWVNNGWVEAKADYTTLTQYEIEQWLKK